MALTMAALHDAMARPVRQWLGGLITARQASSDIWALTAGERLPVFENPEIGRRCRSLLADLGLTYPED